MCIVNSSLVHGVSISLSTDCLLREFTCLLPRRLKPAYTQSAVDLILHKKVGQACSEPNLFTRSLKKEKKKRKKRFSNALRGMCMNVASDTSPPPPPPSLSLSQSLKENNVYSVISLCNLSGSTSRRAARPTQEHTVLQQVVSSRLFGLHLCL